MKINKLYEIFLTKYFCFEALIKPLGYDMQSVFNKLAEVFCLSETEELDTLYKEIQNDDVSSITTYSEYELNMRVLDYLKAVDREISISKDTKYLIYCKGLALKKLESIQERLSDNYSEASLSIILTEMINSCDVTLMDLVSFMIYEGIIVSQDLNNGFDIAWKCAKWNDMFGLLLVLKYDSANCNKYISMLYTLLCESTIKDIYDEVSLYYKKTFKTEIIDEVILTKRYLQRFKEHKDFYDAQISRVIYSGLLSIEDKNRVVLSGSSLAGLNELPLSCESSKCPIPDDNLYLNTMLKRKKETKEIEIALKEQIRGNKVCSPLIICPDSFVKEDCIQAMKKSYSPTKIYNINAKQLIAEELTQTKNHFLISNLMDAKNSNAVFIIEDIDELDDRLVPEFVKILQYNIKKAFKLLDSKVTINLANIVLILFAKSLNVSDEILQLCQIIQTSILNKSEKSIMVSTYINNAKMMYECEKLAFDTEAIEQLRTLESKECEKVVDNVCKQYIYSDKSSSVICLEDIYKNMEKPRVGFGFVIKGERK